MDNSCRDTIGAFLDGHAEELYALSDKIWEFAETRLNEVRSSALQRDYLREKGFAIREGVAGMPTAFIAEYGQGEPVLAILGEYDALDGLGQVADAVEPSPNGAACGHGCGHNLLGVGSLAAALAIKEMLAREKLGGTIRYYGCPAEENAGGKAYLVRDGYFRDVSAALSWHPSDAYQVMSSGYLSNVRVFYDFTGVAAHAAGAPHLGRSALDAVEIMDVGVNYMREHMIDEARIHYAITDAGGSAPNVVQAHAQVLYAIRAPRVADVRELYARVCDVAQGAALITGTTVRHKLVAAYANYIANPVLNEILEEELRALLPLDYSEAEKAYAAGYTATLNPTQLASAEKGLQREIGKKEAAALKGQAILNLCLPQPPENSASGSTDVGNVSWEVPTGQICAATWAFGTPGHSWQATAQGKSANAHKAMLLAAKAMAAAGYRCFRDAGVIDQVREAFRDQVADEDYENPLPAEVRPERW